MASGLYVTIEQCYDIIISALVRMEPEAGDRFLRSDAAQHIIEFLKAEGFSTEFN